MFRITLKVIEFVDIQAVFLVCNDLVHPPLFVVEILRDLTLDQALNEPEVSLLDVDMILVNKILQKH